MWGNILFNPSDKSSNPFLNPIGSCPRPMRKNLSIPKLSPGTIKTPSFVLTSWIKSVLLTFISYSTKIKPPASGFKKDKWLEYGRIQSQKVSKFLFNNVFVLDLNFRMVSGSSTFAAICWERLELAIVV